MFIERAIKSIKHLFVRYLDGDAFMSRLITSISDDTALANILVSDAERNATLAANEFDEVDNLSLVGLGVAIGERV